MLTVLLVAALAAADAPPPAPEAAPCADRLQVGPIGSSSDDMARVAELTGATPVRSQAFRRWSSAPDVPLCSDGRAPHGSRIAAPSAPSVVTVDPLPLTWRTYLDSGYPDDRNDGALWQGRGISTELTGGARLRWGFFSAAAAPVVAWQQNRDFYHPMMTQAGYSPYANPFNYGQLDLPLRMGPTDFWTFDPGQSYARIDLFDVALGISTENLWWGPGVRNSLLMTNSAPGFPHLFLGTSRPADIWIGWLEAQMVWGRLRESKWFDRDPANDTRHFTALNIAFEPRWIPGLFLGLNRVYLYRIPPGGLGLSRTIGWPLVNPFFKDALADPNSPTNPNGDSPDNQLASIFARWVFPQVGLEIYGEWGRDDHSWDFQDFITQPDHSQAFMLGLQKVFPLREGWLRLTAELTHTFEKPPSNAIPGRGTPIFYTHGDEIQGYTQDGQMLGAGVGPQADSQFLALDWFHARGRAGVWVERVLRNDRYFYDQGPQLFGEDAEIAVGARGAWSWRELDLDGSLGYGKRYNMNFAAHADSVKAMLAVTWWPGRTRIPSLPSPTADGLGRATIERGR